MNRKAVLLGIVAFMFLVSSAGARNINDHVYNNNAGKGDMMIFPMFFANDLANTNITVINTSPSRAVVAKVVVRSFKYSQELLDFFIYLTPNDVWEGIFRMDASGNVEVYSEDPSVYNPASSSCASAASPFNYNLASVTCTGDSSEMGYITVFEAWASDEGWLTPDPNHCADIKAAYDTLAPNLVQTEDVLTGYGELVVPGGDYAIFPATVMANYNVNAKLTVGQETFIGDQADNTLGEVEAALAKDAIALPYHNVDPSDLTAWIVNFPTKLSGDCGMTVRGPYFAAQSAAPDFPIEYAMNVYDMNENYFLQECPVSPCMEQDRLFLYDEMNLWLADSQFDRGWARMTFNDSTAITDLEDNTIRYTGAPAIPLFAHLTPDGMSISAAPAFDYGTVRDGLVLLNNYQTLPDYHSNNAQAECDANHLSLCQTEGDCAGVGGNWCDNVCQADECEAPPAEECTEISGSDFCCGDDCTATFPGNIPAIVECEAWVDANCQ